MSNLADLYDSSDKQRPKESREKIPGGSTDFWDREHKFHDGFKTGREKGDVVVISTPTAGIFDELPPRFARPDRFNVVGAGVPYRLARLGAERSEAFQ